MEKTCSNCHRSFVCNVNDIANCQCSTVQLDKDTITTLQATYTDCLCIGCLQTIGSSIKKSNFVPPSEKA